MISFFILKIFLINLCSIFQFILNLGNIYTANEIIINQTSPDLADVDMYVLTMRKKYTHVLTVNNVKNIGKQYLTFVSVAVGRFLEEKISILVDAAFHFFSSPKSICNLSLPGKNK